MEIKFLTAKWLILVPQHLFLIPSSILLHDHDYANLAFHCSFCACTWEDFSMKIIYLGLLHIAIENFTSYFHLLGFILRSIRQFGKLFPIPHWIWLQQIIGLFHKCKFFVWNLDIWNVKLSWKWGDLYKVSDNENCKWEFLTRFLGWLGDILSILKFKVVEQ